MIHRSTSDNRLCCLLSDRQNVTCARTSPPSPLDTCGRLFSSVVLRIAGWVIGLCSLIGNIIVLILRFHHERSITVQTLLIINLAVADCLMGVYMIIITSADVYFHENYFLIAPLWRDSYLCKFTSVLAFVSSECSVFTLTVMSVDRFICIRFPFGKHRLTVKSCRIILICLWVLTLALSLMPLLVNSYIPSFYGLSDVCIGLPLHVVSGETGRLEIVDVSGFLSEFTIQYVVTDTNFHPSWLYGIVTFIGVNMILFGIILLCYVMMFFQVKQSARSVGNTTLRDRELRVARKIALVVGTDFACLMPIVIMGILTQSGLVVLPTSLYAWSVIFIIPINSSINPLLYTFINYRENRKKPAQTRSELTNGRRNGLVNTVYN